MQNLIARMTTCPFADKLVEVHQQHLLDGWEELTEDQQAHLTRQLSAIDFTFLAKLHQGSQLSSQGSEGIAQRAHRAVAPRHLLRLDDPHVASAHAREVGEEMLRRGEVGCLLVAGGQGTRLGHTLPKGVFPIGPVTEKTLFQLLAEQVLARGRKAGRPIPFFIMTSEATHLVTTTFFERSSYFGLDPRDVYFFQQGTMPAIDARTGKILLSGPGCVATSPDGHGGVLTAMARADLFSVMRARGLTTLYYHQVDNPHAIVCDPEFLGHHAIQQSEASTKVVAKVSPEEKMGVMVEVDGQVEIIEYSDLPLDVARRTADDGRLELWAGSTAMHVFNVDFLEQFTTTGEELPFHLAHKVVPWWEQGLMHEPTAPNAFKFERFIFDVLPRARKALVVETSRDREFHPVKNAVGPNSPEEVRHALSELYRRWMVHAGAEIPEGVAVEVSALFALDAEDCRRELLLHPEPVRLATGWYWNG